ncbi:hypothetical protein V1498_10075 [Peribacillus sp. SCS-26]|uniref:hypothetical protein n=1 Tax=Paraperibacillus marinus TaxID=3115295 RepID=UPI0039066B80
MARKYIAERGQKTKVPKTEVVRKILNDRYTINESLEIFVQAKEEAGIRPGTLNGYYATVRYLSEC